MKGVLVGCDRAQEWLLPWWWGNYIQENTLPVAFADLGMSQEGRAWCRERGALISIKIDGYQVAVREKISPMLLKDWDQALSPFWESREAWFKKPFALLHTPFEQTVWLDLDCEVLGKLESIFQYLDCQVGLVRVGEAVYNSGVIVFKKEAPLIQKWAELAFSKNHLFLSDQDALSHLIFREGYRVSEVPDIYNWLMCRGIQLGAVILHWAAQWGKEYIKRHGGLRKEMNYLTRLKIQ